MAFTRPKQVGDLIAERMESKGVSAERLAALTNIPRRYLEALQSNDLKSLPPAPYVRGYLAKIATVFSIDPATLREGYRALELATSGERDSLPGNRYALRRVEWRLVAGAGGVILLLAFAGIRLKTLLGIPTLTVNLSEAVELTTIPSILVSGRVTPQDRVSINAEAIPTDADGSFGKEVLLEEGLNTLEIRATRFLGRETRITRHVLYETQTEGNERASGDERGAGKDGGTNGVRRGGEGGAQ